MQNEKYEIINGEKTIVSKNGLDYFQYSDDKLFFATRDKRKIKILEILLNSMTNLKLSPACQGFNPENIKIVESSDIYKALAILGLLKEGS